MTSFIFIGIIGLIIISLFFNTNNSLYSDESLLDNSFDNDDEEDYESENNFSFSYNSHTENHHFFSDYKDTDGDGIIDKYDDDDDNDGILDEYDDDDDNDGIPDEYDDD